MRRIETLADAQIVLRELLDFKIKIETSGTDLHGLRTRNASPAERKGDYVTYEQLKDVLTKNTDLQTQINNLKAAAAVPVVNRSGATPVITTNGTPSILDSAGNPVTTTVLPSTTPIVNSLPTSGPLLVINQYVIFQGKPYIYTAFPGGSDYWALDVTGSPTIFDTKANLSLYPAASYGLGTVFYATDWKISYAIQFPGGVATWVYYNGIYEAPLASIPAGLGAAEYRMLFRASDYLHNWFWAGSVWSLYQAALIGFAGGLAPGSEVFANPGPPFGGSGQLWQVEDGSTVGVSQEDGTIVATAVPTRSNYWFVR